MTDQLLHRFHQCLVEAIERGGSWDAAQPVTVAQIYQELVPYRAARGTLGIEMNADYEHALLRLLAGEGGYVRLEPEEARDTLRAELQSTNPDVGLFRAFADCEVWVKELPATSYELPATSYQPAVAGSPLPVTSLPGNDIASADVPSEAPAAAATCHACGAALPAGRTVRYCPHCGADQTRRACARCGETLEPEWKFCPECGTAAG